MTLEVTSPSPTVTQPLPENGNILSSTDVYSGHKVRHKV